jgi:glycerol uptake facilitator protein
MPVNDVLGEFLGTMVLILLGDGVVGGVLLSRSKAQNAGWIVITTGWAFAVMAGVFTARAVGAPGFINPVGPLAGVLTGALKPDVAAAYAGAEFAGAFVGAVLVWLHYWPHWGETADPGLKLAVFCTAPAIRMPAANVLSEAIATFALVFVGTAIVEKEIGRGFVAPLGGALVWGIGLSLGGTTGYAINPARDLSPRIAHALLPIPGKGGSDWGYSWIPVVGPVIGATIAALLAKAVMLPR